MSRKHPSGYVPTPILEILEPRIAPATITVGPSSTTGYTSASFISTADQTHADPTVYTLFGSGTAADYYYLNLGPTDQLNYANIGGVASFIDMDAGRAFAFFHDINGDKIVQSNELTGLALAAGTSVKVGFSVNGDILTNLDGKTGLLSVDSLGHTTLIGDTQTITKLSVVGEVNGNILAGGAISSVSAGATKIIGTGTVGNGMTFDFGGVDTVGKGKGTLGAITLAAGKAGPSISNVTVSSVDSIVASTGGTGGIGGSISNVTLQNDSNGFVIQAGAGGTGVVNGLGGAGGKVSGVVVWGVQDTTNDLISIHGGNGGTGAGTGAGGAGGLVEKVYIGYQASGSTYAKSNLFLNDHVEVIAGDGGAGKIAGLGGSLSNINVRVATVGDPNPSSAPTHVGIYLHAGNGGITTDAMAGTDGKGGSVTGYYLLNNDDYQLRLPTDPDAKPAIVAVVGGDGGTGGANGGAGGSVSTGIILSQSIFVESGDGGSGKKLGGLAGSISGLQLAYRGSSALIQFNQQESNLLDVLAHDVRLRAGTGGSVSVTGTGGNGGSITNVTAPLTDLDNFTINRETLDLSTGVYSVLNGADGGVSAGGTGGNGGLVSGVLFKQDVASTNDVGVDVVLRSGDGGNGSTKGGLGGNFASSSFVLTDANITATTGKGGSSSSGSGGNAGLVNILTLSVVGQVGGLDATASLITGNGGDAGLKGIAGNGGNITSATVHAGDSLNPEGGAVVMTSGNGGIASTGTSGNGGAISNAVLFSINSSALLTAGSGGSAPGALTKGGNGGAISTANVQGATDVKILAGNGYFGGTGGGISNAVVSGSVTGLNPSGDVWVKAGNGGANGSKTGGIGGSLLNIVGYTSSNAVKTALFTAGDGGVGTTGTGGKGGSITSLVVSGGTARFSAIAGQGGESEGTSAGGLGGSVTGVSAKVSAFDIAAGDGGNTLAAKGATGGSVTQVNVLGDIGVRSGQDFGFNTMGGIFAGAGGTGKTSSGIAGNVTSITASAISSIVAGRAAAPQLVTKVDSIFLRGNVALQTTTPITVGTPASSFSNASTANYVGGISDPSDAFASEFLTTTGRLTTTQTTWTTQVPLDGLVAALTLGKTGNGTSPNALLTKTTAGAYVLVSKFNVL